MTASAMPMAAAAPRSSMELRNIEPRAAAEVRAIVVLVFVIGFISVFVLSWGFSLFRSASRRGRRLSVIADGGIRLTGLVA